MAHLYIDTVIAELYKDNLVDTMFITWFTYVLLIFLLEGVSPTIFKVDDKISVYQQCDISLYPHFMDIWRRSSHGVRYVHFIMYHNVTHDIVSWHLTKHLSQTITSIILSSPRLVGLKVCPSIEHSTHVSMVSTGAGALVHLN